jgi:hypothetical protein
MTVPVAQDMRRGLMNWFSTESNYFGIDRRSSFSRQPSGLYRRHYYIHLARGECLVELDPRYSGHFMRLDFNPSRSTEGFTPVLRALCTAIPGLTLQDVLSGNTTRVDIAFDVRGIDVESVDAVCRLRLRETTRYWTTEARTFERHGRLNAIVIGAKDAPSRLRIYDKRLERAAVQLGGARRILRSRVRFELQQRGLGPSRSVGDGPNLFERFRLYEHDLLGTVPPRSLEERLFRDAIRWRGAIAVLSQVEDQRQRRRLEQLLRPSATPDYWDAEVLWVEFQQAWRRLFELPRLQSIAI